MPLGTGTWLAVRAVGIAAQYRFEQWLSSQLQGKPSGLSRVPTSYRRRYGKRRKRRGRRR